MSRLIGGRFWGCQLLILLLGFLFLFGCTLPPIIPNLFNVTFNPPHDLPSATAGQFYNYSFCQPDSAINSVCGGDSLTLNPIGGKPPYSITYGPGVHPQGMALKPNGVYSGTPMISGIYNFTVCASDSSGASSCKNVTFTILNGNLPSDSCKSHPCNWWQTCSSDKCVAKTGFCNSNTDCMATQQCNAWTHTCQYNTKTKLGGGTGNCPSYYLLGNDDLCHLQCGFGFYCAGGSQCYNSECLSCDDGYYLGPDGICYSLYNDNYDCPYGYVLGDDDLCHAECGDGYCDSYSQCYNGECLECMPGYYLGLDGYCYEEGNDQYECPEGYYDGNDGYCYSLDGDDSYQCPDGYGYGEDGLCHEECGEGFYCVDGAWCYNGECVICDDGYYLGDDGQCHLEEECDPGYVPGGDGYCYPECGGGYCPSGECCGDQCLYCTGGDYLGDDCQCHYSGECEDGYVLGDDGLCHAECGDNFYCDYYAECCGGGCISCDDGYYLGEDCQCYPEEDICGPGYVYAYGNCYEECGDGFCVSGQCCGDECIACEEGSYLGDDCQCHYEDPCGPGYVLGDGGYCYEECGDGFCASGQCCGGECIACSEGDYLANDCDCYPLDICGPGYLLGYDGYCYEECGDGYCDGGQCCGDECITCQDGYYLASDCECYPDEYICGEGFTYVSGYCYEECGDGYCLDGQCCGGECLACDYGYYLASDCQCYLEEDLCGTGYYLGPDGQCYPEGDSCDPGYVDGGDGYCYPACGSGYCTSGQCCGGECIACPSGTYLANDCQCYYEDPCGGGYIYGEDGYCHPPCGYNTYCISGQCCGGQCIICPGGTYLASDCQCWYYEQAELE